MRDYLTKCCIVTTAALIATIAIDDAQSQSLDFGNANIEVIGIFDPVADSKTAVVPAGSADVTEVFVQSSRPVSAFPTSPNSSPLGFASAAFSGDGIGGAGVSGIVLNRLNATARATLSQDIFNMDSNNETGALFIDFTIPRLEVAITQSELIIDGPFAELHAKMTATTFDADGNQIERDTVFDYALDIKRRNSSDNSFVSPDLLSEQGFPGFFFLDGRIKGVRYEGFDGFKALPSIAPGGRMELSYELFANGGTETPEVGYQALVGDPFNISGGPGFVVSSIPEPSSAWLFVVGAAFLLSMRRRRAK